jgi:hypothetical protein
MKKNQQPLRHLSQTEKTSLERRESNFTFSDFSGTNRILYRLLYFIYNSRQLFNFHDSLCFSFLLLTYRAGTIDIVKIVIKDLIRRIYIKIDTNSKKYAKTILILILFISIVGTCNLYFNALEYVSLIQVAQAADNTKEMQDLLQHMEQVNNSNKKLPDPETGSSNKFDEIVTQCTSFFKNHWGKILIVTVGVAGGIGLAVYGYYNFDTLKEMVVAAQPTITAAIEPGLQRVSSTGLVYTDMEMMARRFLIYLQNNPLFDLDHIATSTRPQDIEFYNFFNGDFDHDLFDITVTTVVGDTRYHEGINIQFLQESGALLLHAEDL